MKPFSYLSIIRAFGFLLLTVLCTNCKKDSIPTNPAQPPPPLKGKVQLYLDYRKPGRQISLIVLVKGFYCCGHSHRAMQNMSRQMMAHMLIRKKLSPQNGTLQLQLHDFRFNIPAGSIIESITITTRRFKSGRGSVKDYFAHLIKKHDLHPTGFASYGVRWSNPGYYPDAEATSSYFQNGSGNNGGLGKEVYKWTPAMINDISFGLRITTYPPVGSSAVVYYDLVSITVQYSIL